MSRNAYFFCYNKFVLFYIEWYKEKGTFMQNIKINELNKLIGNTPLIKIRYSYKNKIKCAYFKAEWYNLTGSIKDRMALNIIKKAYIKGALKEGQTIIETSSGNTGISFSAIGGYLGHPVIILMPEHMSEERKKLILSYGAKLHLVSREEGFLKCLELNKELAKYENAFLPLQFENKSNVEVHFKTTGTEIIAQLAKINKAPDAIIAGVGTGGTLMGIGKKFKKINKNVKIFALEPKSSPTLRVGKKVGTHKIQGIGDDFIPPIIDKNILESIIDVDDDDAIAMAKKITKELGLGIGISSGANFLGAVLINEIMPKNSVVVSVFSDDNKKYLSTYTNAQIDDNKHFITSRVKLLDFNVIL